VSIERARDLGASQIRSEHYLTRIGVM
jgi:hypothetical protein